MKPNLFIGTLVLAVFHFFLPKELNFIAICVVLAFAVPYDRAKYYKSGLTVVWPLLVLALIGFFSGINNFDYLNRDFYRDIFAFSRVIMYFIFGILLSKYVRNLATFYKSFSVFVLLASIEHLSLVAGAISHFNSLDHYRKATGMTNFDEAIVLSLVISALFNRHLRQLLKKRSLTNRVITIVILISFLTYFSRTMIVTLLVLIFFMSDALNIRRLLYFKNRRIFSAVLIVALLFTSLHFLASGNSSGVLLKAFVAKFQRSSEEIFRV